MLKAHLVTIGTEITSGEVINSNAAWVSTQLEDLGVRVFSHLTVRDQRDEIVQVLSAAATSGSLVVVTGGLGPTSDDITRACLAEFAGVPLEFDADVWAEMQRFYLERGLPLREAHKQQCYFPRGSERLKNPVGTALGFRMKVAASEYFVLPGPPRELEGIWQQEVVPRLKPLIPATSFHWLRWTCIGSPESEVAELVEKAIEGSGIEVGYRAAVPYVKVKIYVDQNRADHKAIANQVEAALTPFLVGRGASDLAEELLSAWPRAVLTVADSVSGTFLIQRLFAAQKTLRERKMQAPRLIVHVTEDEAPPAEVRLTAVGEEFTTTISLRGGESASEKKTLPYRVVLGSERGKRSAAEWALWNCVKVLRASSRQA